MTGPEKRPGEPGGIRLWLMRLIIGASTEVGDLVLDPFCYPGNSYVASREHQCSWIGIDRDKRTFDTLKAEYGIDISGRTEPPTRQDL